MPKKPQTFKCPYCKFAAEDPIATSQHVHTSEKCSAKLHKHIEKILKGGKNRGR